MKNSKLKKILSILLCVSFLLQQTGFAQVASVELNLSSRFASAGNALSNVLSPDKFRPVHLRSISYDQLNNNFKLLIDKGDTKNPKNQEIESTTKDLLNYFFVGIALPNSSFWVNLRPDAPTNIIDPLLAQTEVGKILLEADLQLKKDTAEATNPQSSQGKAYWNKLYAKANEIYGNQNVNIPTLTRPWIVPDEIIIRESTNNAYIYKATLKVMLEQDYLKDNSTYSFKDDKAKQLNEYSSQIIRQEIIPKLTKEINSAKRYAQLRQVYYSLILAQWFKARNLNNPNNPYAQQIDRKDLTNLKTNTPYSVDTYFNSYKQNFTQGQYNIKEPVYTPYGQVVRNYFSGGVNFGNDAMAANQTLITVGPGKFFSKVKNLIGVNISADGKLKVDEAALTVNTQRPILPKNEVKEDDLSISKIVELKNLIRGFYVHVPDSKVVYVHRNMLLKHLKNLEPFFGKKVSLKQAIKFIHGYETLHVLIETLRAQGFTISWESQEKLAGLFGKVFASADAGLDQDIVSILESLSQNVGSNLVDVVRTNPDTLKELVKSLGIDIAVEMITPATAKNVVLSKYKQLFFDERGLPTGYARNMERYGKVFEAIVKGKEHHPIAVEFHVSGDCQLNCRYCIGGERRASHKDSSLEPQEIERFIDQIIEYNKASSTSFTDIKFGGLFNDPLAIKGKAATLAGLRKAIDHKFWVGITTNGVGLNEESARIIVGDSEKSAKLLNISLDAGSWQSYHKLKLDGKSSESARAVYQNVIDNTRRVVGLRNQSASGLHIGISYVLQDENCSPQELIAAVKTAVELGVDDISFRMPHTKSEGAPSLVDIENAYDCIKNLQHEFSKSHTRINLSKEEDDAKNSVAGLKDGYQVKSYDRCFAPFVRMTVGGDGNVYVCEHRAYKGGGSYAHISDGFQKIVKSVERTETINTIKPLQDEKCKFCALHNHLTNQIINDLSQDYEQFPDLFEWLAKEYPFFDVGNIRHAETAGQLRDTLEVIKSKKTGHPYQNEILSFTSVLENVLKDHALLNEMPIWMAEKESRSSPEVLSKEQLQLDMRNALKGDKSLLRRDTFDNFKVGEDYNARECITKIFSDEAFLSNLKTLALGEDGFSAVEAPNQKYLADLSVQRLKEIFLDSSSNADTQKAAEECTGKFLDLIQKVLRLTYPYTSFELKESIKQYLPYYVRHSLDVIFQELNLRYGQIFRINNGDGKEYFYRYFTDVLISSVYSQIDRLQANRYDFYQRQLFITTSIFDQGLKEFADQKGLTKDFYPVMFLTDSEPLSYPILSDPEANRRAPLFVYLNRQSFMTKAERAEYNRRDLKYSSEHAQIQYALSTKVMSFLQGTNNRDSLVERVVYEAREQAQRWFLDGIESLVKKQGRDVTAAELAELKLKYKNDCESLFYLLAARSFLELINSDPEVEQIFKYVKDNILPQAILNNGARTVFIDTGIKGSIAILAASLVNFENISGRTYSDKLAYLQRKLANQQQVRDSVLPAYVYMYGVLESIRDVVPNAGFGRFGHGGVNSFMEALPKYSAFAGLDSYGMPVIKRADEISVYGANLIARGYHRLFAKRDKVISVAKQEEVVAAVEKAAAGDKKPLLAFIDIDNVVFRPQGYVGSEKWFGDTFATIPDWAADKKQDFFNRNTKHENRLLKAGLYETVLDCVSLKKELQARFPDRVVTFVAFSARRQIQSSETEAILSSLGQNSAFDVFDYSTKMGENKYQRLSAYLAKHSIQSNDAHIFLVDDAMHNIVPFLEQNNTTLIHYTGAGDNYSAITGYEFLKQALAQLKEMNNDRAQDRFFNAISTLNMPFNGTLATQMVDVGMIDADAAENIRRLIDLPGDYLSSAELEREEEIRVALDKKFPTSLQGYREHIKKVIESARETYGKHEALLQEKGILLDEYVEDAVLDYAFSLERTNSHVDYLKIFINILSAYFTPQKIKGLLGQGAVFASQFQWIDLPGRDYAFYYKDRYYCYIPDGEILMDSSSYQDLLVKNINYTMSKSLAQKSMVETVVVYPSLYCNVGCKICLFSSGKQPLDSAKDSEMFLNSQETKKAIELINSGSGLKTLVIGGGGEPFLEEDSVFSLIEKSRVGKIKIYSSGDWGMDEGHARAVFERLEESALRHPVPVAIELNLSADLFHAHGITGRKDGYEHLSRILDLYCAGRAVGKFNNISLHLRSISKDGNIPDNDPMIENVIKYSSYHFTQIGKVEAKQTLECKELNGVTIDISYNKMMQRNAASSLQFLHAMQKDASPFILNNMFINANGNVALGGYYESVSVGTLNDESAYLGGLLKSNIIVQALSERGFSYLYRLVEGYSPEFIANPPPAGTQLEMIKNIFADPGLGLYVYLNVLNDLYKAGRLDEKMCLLLGFPWKHMEEYIQAVCGRSVDQVLDQEVARKVNWGFKVDEQEIEKLSVQEQERSDELLRFGNIWWDVGDDQQRQILRDRVAAVANTGQIKDFITERIKKRYGLDSEIKSISVVGGFITNRSSRQFTHDLDLIVVLKNSDLLDFVPETEFDFGNTFNLGALPSVPEKICVWIVGEKRLSADSSNSIVIDIAQNTQSGLVLEGTRVQAEPAPVLERLKQAYFFANMIMKMASDRDLIKMLKRRYELRGMLEQLRQIAYASDHEINQSLNIAKIDKLHLREIQKSLRSGISVIPINPLDKQSEIDAALAKVIDNNIPDDLKLFFMQKRRRAVLEEVSSMRDTLFQAITEIYGLQKNFFADKPLQEAREWNIDIFKANTTSRSIADHRAIANKAGLDYPILIGLAEKTRYPSILEKLFLVAKNQNIVKGEQAQQLIQVIAANPMLPFTVQKEIAEDYQQPDIFSALTANYALHKDVRDFLNSHRNEAIAHLAEKNRDFAARVNNVLIPDSLSGSSDQRENLFCYLVHKKYGGQGAQNYDVESFMGGLELSIKQYLVADLPTDQNSLRALYDRYKDIYNTYFKDYRGELQVPTPDNLTIFNSQMLRLSTAICERVLNTYNFSDVPLYRVLSEESLERLISDIMRSVCAAKTGIFMSDTKQFLPAPIKIGIITQEAMRGCSIFNSLPATTIESYINHEIPPWLVQVEHISRYSTPDEEIAKKKYDIVGIEVLQEEPASLQILSDFIKNVPLLDIAQQVIVYGSIFALDGSEIAVDKIISGKIKDPLMIAGEPEPGFLDAVENKLFGKPIDQISNKLFVNNKGVFSVQKMASAYVSRIDHQLAQNLSVFKNSRLSNYYIETSRGCKWNCKFCMDKKIYSRGWRPYPIKTVVSMFKELETAGLNQVFIFDKDFWNGDYEHARALAKALVRSGNKVRFSVAMRAEEIVNGEELLDLYKQAGLQFVFLGVESFVDGALKRFNKGTTVELNLKALSILEKHGIDFGFGYMLDPLYSFDEFLDSLKVMGAYDYWRQSTTFFGEMLIKSGVDYATNLKEEGLLGRFDSNLLTYAKEYKDPKLARLVRVTKKYMLNAHLINFAFLPAKRSIPLTERERVEHEKYSQFYQLLQKANFDFLMDLASEVNNSISDDELDMLIDRHIKIYQDKTRYIMENLDETVPVSLELINYLRSKLGFQNNNDGEVDHGSSTKLNTSLSQSDKGGIDLRTLPIRIQLQRSLNGLNFTLPQLSLDQLKKINLDLELQQIKNMVQAGITPAGARVKGLVAACVQKGQINFYADNLLLCLVDILRLEEDNASESSAELKEALIIVDSQN
ncbi:MAG: radical SAM protein [Candidatus Omnitrophota bacterium]